MGCGVAAPQHITLPVHASSKDKVSPARGSRWRKAKILTTEGCTADTVVEDGTPLMPPRSTSQLSDSNQSVSDDSCDEGATPEQVWAQHARRLQRQERKRKRENQQASPRNRDASAKSKHARGELLPQTSLEPLDAGVSSFDELYILQERISKGSYGVVSRCTNRQTGDLFAVKTIPKRKVMHVNQVWREAKLMRKVGVHEHVAQLQHAFEDSKCIHIVMELCRGGELADRVPENVGLPSHVVARLGAQILAAVAYLHSVCIAHRDLKPENFLLATQESTLSKATLKLVDFGGASQFTPGQAMHTSVYTAAYVAPEVLSGSYTEACDVWSIGVMLYFLLTGNLPFVGASEEELLGQVRRAEYSLEGPVWEADHEVKSIVSSMMAKGPAERASASQVLASTWFSSSRSPAGRQQHNHHSPQVADALTSARGQQAVKAFGIVSPEASDASAVRSMPSPCSSHNGQIRDDLAERLPHMLLAHGGV